MTRPTSRVPCRCARTRVYVNVYTFTSLHTLPDVTNHHRSLMTDVTGCIRRAGGMNYAFVRVCVCVCVCVCVRVGSSFTYRKIRNARLFLAVLSVQFRLAGRGDIESGKYRTRDNDICQGRYEVENICRYF